MSGVKVDKLVRMANQIGDFFAAQRDADAAKGVAEHLTRFWTPKMVAEIVERAGHADCGLGEIAARGVALLSVPPP